MELFVVFWAVERAGRKSALGSTIHLVEAAARRWADDSSLIRKACDELTEECVVAVCGTGIIEHPSPWLLGLLDDTDGAFLHEGCPQVDGARKRGTSPHEAGGYRQFLVPEPE